MGDVRGDSVTWRWETILGSRSLFRRADLRSAPDSLGICFISRPPAKPWMHYEHHPGFQGNAKILAAGPLSRIRRTARARFPVRARTAEGAKFSCPDRMVSGSWLRRHRKRQGWTPGRSLGVARLGKQSRSLVAAPGSEPGRLGRAG